MRRRDSLRWLVVGPAWVATCAAGADANYVLIDEAGLEAARKKAASNEWAGRALAALVRRADGSVASDLKIPERGGQWPHWYSCPRDGVRLRTESPTVHRCPHCGATYTGEPYDSVPAYFEHQANASAARDLALAFRLTGKTAYRDRAVALLSGYAARYESYPLHDKDGKAKTGGGRVLAQTLDESVWLIPMAWSYGLVRGTLDAETRKKIESHLLRPAADVIRSHKMGIHNIQCWKNSAVGVAGFASGAQELVKEAIDDPDRGFRVQIGKGVRDGIWWEGSLGYHAYTMQALWPLAEAARVAGIDLYSDLYRSLYDGPLDVALPNGDAPGFNDNAGARVSSLASLFELAFARWKKPAYGMVAGSGRRESVESLLWGSPETPSGDPVPAESRVLREIGFAVLRSPRLTAAVRFGTHGGGHGHPDKLNVVTFGGGRQLGLDPGSINYGVPLHAGWYRTTIAHNTVTVDGASQSNADGRLDAWESSVEPRVTKLVASAPGAYAGVLLRRSLRLDAAGRLEDRFECVSESEHVYDWAFHAPGVLSVSVDMTGREEPLGSGNGYQHLTKVRAGRTSEGWTAEWGGEGGAPLVLRVEGAAGTEVFTAVGPGRDPLDAVPALVVRRRGRGTVFGVVHGVG